ncbi:MAG TPA: Rrf2 family transcriptional regulator [Arcobacter sp.]|nr:Rrf2 family transcriptional regulator [Arcobacter sp.]HIP56253.1 Rrf2 family transcriptional regulator [Arcobacter sp.]
MKLNITSQYAIRILTHFVQNQNDKLFSAKVISTTLDIPYKYLTSIMTQLVNANIILSSRGRDGGYKLAKNANEIRLLDILESVKECINADNCVLGMGVCREEDKCALHDEWKAPKEHMVNMFKNTTLEDLKNNK